MPDKIVTKSTFGQIASDKVASVVGSWKFILIQSTIIAFWIYFNTQIPTEGWQVGGLTIKPWDPYPFIFLNLTLSFQAAYTAPIIMMSQNRQSHIDRQHAEEDYRVNREAKADVEHVKQELRRVHHKLVQHQVIQSDIVTIASQVEKIQSILEEMSEHKNKIQTK
jgi:uncharacterized membrane protein